MLRQTYQGKSIVILGVQSVVGRVLIKQLISCIGQQHICAIEMGQDKSKRDKFQHSSYFSTKEQ